LKKPKLWVYFLNESSKAYTIGKDMKKNVLIIDAYNMIHRCRFQWGGGFVTGDNQIVYNFLRTLRATVEQFNPDKIYFPLDGKPTVRLEMYPEYKGARRVETTDPDEIAYWKSFKRQKKAIIEMMGNYFPVTSMYHPDYECDDLVLHIIKTLHPSDYVTIVSSDTDFIQILNDYPDTVSLYNPVASSYRQNTDYDYVSWKAMVGDKSDNIPGVKGIGKKTASKILSIEGELENRMKDSKFNNEYNTSYDLIRLMPVDTARLEVSASSLNESEILALFKKMEFESMLKEPYYSKFISTFSETLSNT
jgi:DNA polymerase-1